MNSRKKIRLNNQVSFFFGIVLGLPVFSCNRSVIQSCRLLGTSTNKVRKQLLEATKLVLSESEVHRFFVRLACKLRFSSASLAGRRTWQEYLQTLDRRNCRREIYGALISILTWQQLSRTHFNVSKLPQHELTKTQDNKLENSFLWSLVLYVRRLLQANSWRNSKQFSNRINHWSQGIVSIRVKVVVSYLWKSNRSQSCLYVNMKIRFWFFIHISLVAYLKIRNR